MRSEATADVEPPPARPRGVAGGQAAAQPRGLVAVESLPLVYVNMPKSGCTTIKNLLHRLDGGAFLADPLTVHDRTDLFLSEAAGPEALDARLARGDIVFTFVRHPLRRAYSCFNEKLCGRGPYAFGRIRAALARDYGARFEASPSLERHRENFKAFLRFSGASYRGENGWRRDPHWCPQSMTLRAAARWRAIDFIGRVERLDAGLRAVLALAGIACDLVIPRLNEGRPPPWPYAAMLDDEVRALGAALFAEDLRLFGYAIGR